MIDLIFITAITMRIIVILKVRIRLTYLQDYIYFWTACYYAIRYTILFLPKTLENKGLCPICHNWHKQMKQY